MHWLRRDIATIYASKYANTHTHLCRTDLECADVVCVCRGYDCWCSAVTPFQHIPRLLMGWDGMGWDGMGWIGWDWRGDGMDG